MPDHAPLCPNSEQTRKLMALLGMPNNVTSFVIRGKYDDVIEVELTYMPSEDVFDKVFKELND